MIRRRVSQVFDPSQFDYQSLVNSRVFDGEWVYGQYKGIYSCSLVETVDDQEGVVCGANLGADSLQYGTQYTYFVCPVGVTSVRFEVRIKRPPTSVSTNRIRCGIFNTGFDDFLNGASISVQPTDEWVTTTLTYTGLVPGQRYYPIFNFNFPDGQAPCLVKFARVVPVGATGFFGGPFWRLACTPRTGIHQGQPEAFSGNTSIYNTYRSSVNTRFPVLTDATDFYVEMNVGITTFLQYVGVAMKVANGDATLVPPASIFDQYSLAHFSAGGAGTRRVEVGTIQAVKFADVGAGTWARGLYVGPCATLSLAGSLAPAAPSFLVVGDSVPAGFFGDAGDGAWAKLTDQRRVSALMRAVAGQAFFDTCATAQARTDYVALLGTIPRDNLYLVVSANDALTNAWGGGAGGVAAFKAAREDFLDKYHAAYPEKGVYLQSALVWANPTTDAIVMEPYRVADGEVAAARPWVTFISGPSLLDRSWLIDDYHPGPAGTAVLAANLGLTLGV